MSINHQKKIHTNKFHDHSKLELIKQISNLVFQYHNLVFSLSDMFIKDEEKEILLIEISMLEELIKSKLIISSIMRGF
jgi:hypothetical protein